MCQTCGIRIPVGIVYGQDAPVYPHGVSVRRQYVASSKMHLVEIRIPEAVYGQGRIGGTVRHVGFGLVFHYLGHGYRHRRHQQDPAYGEGGAGHDELHHAYATFTP